MDGGLTIAVAAAAVETAAAGFEYIATRQEEQQNRMQLDSEIERIKLDALDEEVARRQEFSYVRSEALVEAFARGIDAGASISFYVTEQTRARRQLQDLSAVRLGALNATTQAKIQKIASKRRQKMAFYKFIIKSAAARVGKSVDPSTQIPGRSPPRATGSASTGSATSTRAMPSIPRGSVG